LGCIDIPKADNIEPYPQGPDPQTWQRSWTTVTDQNTLAKHISAANQRQYNQATDTPFGMEPLKTYFGYKGDTKGADNLVDGHLPTPDIMQQLLPETQSILKYLATFIKQPLGDPIPLTITKDQFKNLYNNIEERTSSSPSGRHLGHYKVAAKSNLLAELHTNMMSIPYMVGISPQQWRQVVDVMLEKKP